MSRYAVSEEVHHQDPAGHKQHPSLCVNVVALRTLDITGHRPGQVAHTLYSQLLSEVLLKGKYATLYIKVMKTKP